MKKKHFFWSLALTGVILMTPVIADFSIWLCKETEFVIWCRQKASWPLIFFFVGFILTCIAHPKLLRIHYWKKFSSEAEGE